MIFLAWLERGVTATVVTKLKAEPEGGPTFTMKLEGRAMSSARSEGKVKFSTRPEGE